MNIWKEIKLSFKQNSSVIKLIYINIGIFAILKVLSIFFQLFNVTDIFIYRWLAIPANLTDLPHRFWTPVAYMFVHEGFLHLFFNMICLYWFGKMFLSMLSEKHLVGIYLVGGLASGLFYVLVYNIFPYYASSIYSSILIGASGSIMAIIAATATKMPNIEVRLLFLGNIKLKYIAIVTVLISFFSITSSNGGGEIAHLGGALTGYLFIILLNKGRDITAWMNKILDGTATLFRPKKKMKVKKRKLQFERKMNDGEYNQQKVKNMAEIDHILDKIKESGYNSLTSDEKKRLFDQSKK